MNRKRSIVILVGVLVVGCTAVGYWLWERYGGEPFLPGLDIVVPDGYELSREEGLDFDVYYLRPADKNAPAKAGLGVYVGWCPNSFRPKSGCGEESALLCGKNVKWYKWEEEADGSTLLHREAYFTFGRKQGRVTLHAFISCEDRTQLRLLQDAAGTIRMVPERKGIPWPTTGPATTSSPAGRIADSRPITGNLERELIAYPASLGWQFRRG